MAWKITGASVQGLIHRNQDKPCQDACHWKNEADHLVAVVCDGAGSATNSHTGAHHGAIAITGEITSRLNETTEKGDHNLREIIENAIEQAREQLAAKENTTDLRTYHATVVGLVIDGDNGVFFHIGDGAAVAVSDDCWQQAAVSLPENGEFADQTYFYTENTWRQKLRITPLPPDTQMIALMSDGAMSFILNRQATGLDEKFIIPVDRYLTQQDESTGAKALASTLDRPETHAITGDDKTLVWARRI